ncbi:hypothetical protein [Methanoplanus limicola]|uniref:Uncharacterized protein n=1 Tax=Methanoplanus limicola DSM 2279 TaxID=937775 RepID=H1Z194_9EURY|nr:hypothetical protein [Methanoplanus limicola]EHQ35361.1 hypothetical protein Metlim_1252 [Methanoplanus limicola DSM 2279]
MKPILANFFSKVQTAVRRYYTKTCMPEKVRPDRIPESLDKIKKSRQKDVYFTNHAKKYQGILRLKDIYYLPQNFWFFGPGGLSCKVKKYRLLSDVSALLEYSSRSSNGGVL